MASNVVSECEHCIIDVSVSHADYVVEKLEVPFPKVGVTTAAWAHACY